MILKIILKSLACVGIISISMYINTYNKESSNDTDRLGIPKQNITGVSWRDYNNDGYVDLIVGKGINGVSLYKNIAGKKFEDVTQKANLTLSKGLFVYSAIFGDYNNDGCADIFISAVSDIEHLNNKERLFKGNCEYFTDETKKSGINIPHKGGRGASWGDYNNDGYIDIYIANYGNASGSLLEELGYIYEANILYKNNGDGTFTDITSKAKVDGLTKKCGVGNHQNVIKNFIKNQKTQQIKLSYQPIWLDYNNDNNIDLFVATDSGFSPLYKNNGDGTFADATSEAGMCKEGTGMGVASGDYNNDGYIDLYVTNVGHSYLWENKSGVFKEVSIDMRAPNPMNLGWGVNFLDYDNDGLLDIYIANGRVQPGGNLVPEIGKVTIDKIYKNTGSKFISINNEELANHNYPKESSAIADYNNDGLVDIFVASGYLDGKLNKLHLNKNSTKNWIAIKLIGEKSNKDAIGAKIKLETDNGQQMREITAGSSYLAQNDLIQHFGLNNAQSINQLNIEWPSGKTTVLKNIKTNQRITINE